MLDQSLSFPKCDVIQLYKSVFLWIPLFSRAESERKGLKQGRKHRRKQSRTVA